MLRSASRSGVVALTSAALMGLSALAIPAVAAADDATCAPEDVTYSVTGGTIEWGYKQSFRSYFFGGFAHGELTTSEGVTIQGDRKAADGRIVWPVTSGSVNSVNSATASGTGDANFNAHGGALDTTLSNPTIEINGTEGVLKMDYEGNQFTTNPNDTPVPLTGTQVVAATFDLETAPDLHAGGTTTITSGPSIIGDDFVEVFGSYPSGSALDPVTTSLTVTTSCDASGEPGGGDNGGGDNGGDNNNGGGIFGSLGNIFGSLKF